MVAIIADVRVPAVQFPLGRILVAHPGAEIVLERLVPTSEGIVPLFWVRTETKAAVEETLCEDPLVEDFVRLIQRMDRTLYSADWSPEVDGLVRTLVDLGVDVLSAEGTVDAWEFRLQFRNREGLKRFRRACKAQGIDLKLVELYDPMMPPEKGPLTSEQADVLMTAYENGYWDVPREITQEELADLIGIGGGTLSRRLREGVKATVGELLFGSGGKPYE